MERAGNSVSQALKDKGERVKAKNLPKKSRTTSTPNAKLSPESCKPYHVETKTGDPKNLIDTSTSNRNLNPGICNSSQLDPKKSNIDGTTFLRDQS